MRTRILLGLWCALSAITAFTSGTPTEAASFRLLFESSESPSTYTVTAVSGDGSTVVGGKVPSLDPGVNAGESWRWTAEEGVQFLGHLHGGPVASVGAAYAVSADGSVIVGVSENASGEAQAYRWTVLEGLVGLGDGEPPSAGGVSGDGSVVVGSLRGVSGTEAYRWTRSEGVIALGVLGRYPPFDGFTFSDARAVSADGRAVVGQSTCDGGIQAFRWTALEGMVGLGYLEGDGISAARDVSSDGSVIVGGSGYSPDASEAVLWTEPHGMVRLGHLHGDGWSEALAVTADGCVVVGMSGDLRVTTPTDEAVHASASGPLYPNVFDAFIWDAAHGMRNLRDVLIQEYGLDIPVESLGRAADISADGTVIVGNAPEGPWMVVIPEPCSGVLALIAVIAILAYARRKRHHAV